MTPTCFDLLDAHVVSGHADDEALRDGATAWTYARLLEDVAAFGGVLRHCGVVAGDPVAVALAECAEAVVAVLAAVRIGAVPVLTPAGGGKVLVTASTELDVLHSATADVVLVKQRPDAPAELRGGRDYDWDVVMRAGRTDPAPCVPDPAEVPDDARVQAWVDTLGARGTVRLHG